MMTLIKHYYGNLVRVIFIAGAVLMVIGLPTMTRILDLPVALSIAGIVVLVVAAGFTNPAVQVSLVANAVISIIYTIAFAYVAWHLYTNRSVHQSFLVVNQIATIAFLVASYFSVKSWRGALVQEIAEKNEK